MDILPEPIAFQWDAGNIDKNLRKHDVTVQEAEEVFSNEPLIVSSDKEHSTSRERRWFALGKTRSNRRLFTVFTIRNNNIRIISIRDMTEAEEDVYENYEENS